MIQRLAPEPTMRLVESPYLTEDIGHWIEPIRIARQPRSRRLWKKLCQRRRRTSRLMTIPMRDALRLPDGSLVMHTARAAMLRQELAARCEKRLARSVNEVMFGAGLIL